MIRARTLAWLAVVASAKAAAGCTRTTEVKPSALHTTHVSPPPVTVPRLPPGSFDRAKAKFDANGYDRVEVHRGIEREL